MDVANELIFIREKSDSMREGKGYCKHSMYSFPACQTLLVPENNFFFFFTISASYIFPGERYTRQMISNILTLLQHKRYTALSITKPVSDIGTKQLN